jgi:polyisoprenyl-phosphate glycosyltransferase
MIISVIVPCFNEEAVINESYRRLSGVLQGTKEVYELIFVNDGSYDKTEMFLEQIAKNDSSVRVITFSRNFGHQSAITAGINRCRGDVAVIIDADLQDPPEIIPEMLRIHKEKGANVVYGIREKRQGENFLKLITAKFFYRIMNFLSEEAFPVDTGDFRLIDRNVIDNFNRLKEKNKYVRGLISWMGYKQCPVYYTRQERFAGYTKYPFRKMLKFATISLVYFSKKPLKIATTMGIISVIPIVIYALLNLYFFFFGDKVFVTGWTSMVVLIVFFGGVQLLTIGILGQYIGVLFDEIKCRPEYIIARTVNLENVENPNEG